MKFFRGKNKLWILLIVIALAVFFLNFFQKETKNLFYLASSPFQKIFWKAGGKTANFFETISEIKNLKKDNESIKLKNQEILAENSRLKELKKENEILRQALEIGLEKEFKFELAEIIGKDISQDSLIIDKGEKDGLSKDLPVITQQKVLVGRVSEVYKNFSKVILISNPKSSLDAKISGCEIENCQEEIYGIIKGEGNFKVLFDLALLEKEIKEGDVLVTSALGGTFPKGLLIGQIEKVQKTDAEPFQKAAVLPAFDISRLEKVFVVTKIR